MSFFRPGGTGRNIAGLLGDVLLQQTGHQAAFAPAMRQRQMMQFEEQQRQRARMEGREDKLWEAENAPRKSSVFEMGNSLVSYDPASGPSVVYQGENPAEQYAKMLGAQPGTPEYVNAIKDFVLKSNGPTGIAADQEMLDRRFSNSQALRGTPTYQQTHPSPKAAGKPQYEYRMGPSGKLQKRRVN